MWPIVFVLFGVKWVMLKAVVALLRCWRRKPALFRSIVWNVMPLCFTWTIWWETGLFEGLRFLLIGLSLCFWIFFFFEFSTIFCCNVRGTQCTASDFSHPFLFIFNEIFVYFSERGSVMLPLNGIEDKNLYFI
jgi:hypothetical protein